MRAFCWTTFRRFIGQTGFLAAALGICLPIDAGEKLNIGGARTRIQPGSEDTTSAKIKSVRTISSPSPFDGITPQSASRRRVRDLKLEKKMQNERDERENWVLLAPGELQQAEGEEYDFGVRDYTADDLEKSDGPRDYTFYGVDRVKDSDQSGRGQSGDASQRREMTQPRSGSAEMREGSSARIQDAEENRGRSANPNPFRSARSGENTASQGAHMATELDFSGMLGTGGSGDKAPLHQMLVVPDPGLRSLLGSSISAPQQEDHQQRVDSFRRMLNKGLSRPDVLPELLGDSADRTRQPLNPVISSTPQPGAGNLLRQPTFDSPNPSMPAGSPSLPDGRFEIAPLRNTAVPDAPQPNLFQSDRGPSRGSAPMQEIPRRKF